MANFGQAMFNGSVVIIHCGQKMTCCEREQSQAKCKRYNREIRNEDQPGPLSISPPKPKATTPAQVALKKAESLASTKCTAQADAWANFRNAMENEPDPKKRLEIAKKNSVSPCVAEQVAERWNRGRRTSRGLGVQQDHLIEVKWGGPANPEGLKALGSRVNNFFGSIAKRTGDDMIKANHDEISAIHFVCDPPCKPPKKGDENNNYSTGPGGPPPSGPCPPPRMYKAD